MIYTIKKKLVSWSDSFEIFDESDNVAFKVVADILALIRTYRVYDENNHEIGSITRKVMSLLPTYIIEKNGQQIGSIKKQASVFKPKYSIDYSGYKIEGDLFSWNFLVKDKDGTEVAKISKEHLHLRYTYKIDIKDGCQNIVDLILFVVVIYELLINDK